MTWFDAHLDLAYLAVNKRDMAATLDPQAGPHAPAAITLPSLAEGGVRMALATVFTEPGGEGPEGYPAGDAERAFLVGRAQIEVYLTWRDRGLASLDLCRLLRREPGTGELRGGMGVAEPVPHTPRRLISRLPAAPPIHLGILVENADPIRSPADLAWWKERGVVAIGLAWAKSSRYAGGNTTRDGLTPIGRELVAEMDRLRIVHDVSHLSDRAFDDLCDVTDRPIIASHSNSRHLLGDPGDQRHLTDEQIKRIGERGGVIGLNLYSKFLVRGMAPPPRAGADGGVEPARATIAHAVAHIEHTCQLTGSRRHVGLGSDVDGGFAASRMPEGIDRPRDLRRLAEALSARGWSDDEVFDFACGNWVRFWSAQP